MTGAPVLDAAEVLADGRARQQGDSAEAALLRQALTAPPVTIRKMQT